MKRLYSMHSRTVTDKVSNNKVGAPTDSSLCWAYVRCSGGPDVFSLIVIKNHLVHEIRIVVVLLPGPSPNVCYLYLLVGYAN